MFYIHMMKVFLQPMDPTEGKLNINRRDRDARVHNLNFGCDLFLKRILFIKLTVYIFLFIRR